MEMMEHHCRKELQVEAKQTLGTITSSLAEVVESEDEEPPEKERRTLHNERKRRTVNSIFMEQGPYYVRRAYRMDSASFWELHRLVLPSLETESTTTCNNGTEKLDSANEKRKRNAKNGLISSPVRLSVAIRYFSGGRPDDIALVHGISHSSVYMRAYGRWLTQLTKQMDWHSVFQRIMRNNER